MQQRVNLVQHP